jgi:hypothetical protein
MKLLLYAVGAQGLVNLPNAGVTLTMSMPLAPNRKSMETPADLSTETAKCQGISWRSQTLRS